MPPSNYYPAVPTPLPPRLPHLHPNCHFWLGMKAMASESAYPSRVSLFLLILCSDQINYCLELRPDYCIWLLKSLWGLSLLSESKPHFLTMLARPLTKLSQTTLLAFGLLFCLSFAMVVVVVFFFFSPFLAAPVVQGSSQSRDWIPATLQFWQCQIF